MGKLCEIAQLMSWDHGRLRGRSFVDVESSEILDHSQCHSCELQRDNFETGQPW